MIKIPKILKPKKPDMSSNTYLSHTYQLSSTVIAMSLLGWWIDSTWNTGPTWILTLSILGIVSGLYSFIKAVLEQDKRNKLEKEKLNNSNK